jgi:hypothetical protein
LFNPLTPSELSGAMSRLLREAARMRAAPDPHQSARLLAAYSIGKYLAVELEHGAELRDWFQAAVTDELAGSRAGQAVREARDAAELGERIAEAMAGDGIDERLRGRLRALLREMADREVAMLAAAPSPPTA